jgi:hypothetical protein
MAATSDLRYDPGYKVFVSSSAAHNARADAYDYAELRPSGTRMAIPCMAGGELHGEDGSAMPILPGDWVVEGANGVLASVTAEEIADAWEFVSGDDVFRQAYDSTLESVKSARERPAPNPAPVPQPEPSVLRADDWQAAEQRAHQRSAADLQIELAAQAERAAVVLASVSEQAAKRDLITEAEAAEWRDSGVAPEGITVRFEQALGSYEVTRSLPESVPTASPDAAAEVEGDA